MRSQVSIPLFLLISVGACSEANFKEDMKTTTPGPKAADTVVETPDAIAATPEMKAPETVPAPIPVPAPIAQTPQKPVPPTPANPLKDKCEAGVGLKIVEQAITFAERKPGCDFTEDDVKNGNGQIRALKTATQSLKLPPGEVCDVSIESGKDQNSFRYDDVLIFSLDNYVLAASTVDIKPKLTMTNGFPTWDKAALIGFAMNFDGQAFCVGDAKDCAIPISEQVGTLALNLPFTSVGPLLQLYKGKTEVPLSLTVAGDNDPKTDCGYEKLDLIVKMKYLP